MRFAGLAILLCAVSLPATIVASSDSAIAQSIPASATYKNAKAPIEARVDDLLSRMTLEEKIAQIITIWDNKPEIFDAQGEFDPLKMSAKFPDGIGQFARPSDAKGPASPRTTKGRDIRGTVRLVNALQKHAVTKTRLGIPILMHEEGLHGYAALDATSFPQAIALASSWDPDLLREINVVIGREIRARGVHLALSPVVDVARDPRWGRIEETFGEDPYLAGELGCCRGRRIAGKQQGVDTSFRQSICDTQAPHRSWSSRKRYQCGACLHFRTCLARIFLSAVRTGGEAYRHSGGHGFLQ